ncbi:hypothetical protein CC78DRAFT_549151 [Lojkania enalia]|uniref:ABM domain-containing protein n=1 Tax=Lojkania enalia TaxID=147567 RepID=A0A9P4N4K9_9PLEO|nr:hypothetical protein CC78DRAFT_549151 [Didymosphaeria enalia]
MVAPNPSLSLQVKITIAPSDAERFLEALKPAYDAVVAEPENVYFEVFRDPENGGVFKFVEHWNASMEWLVNVQLKKEYYKPYLAVTEPMFLKPREVEVWERMPGNEWVAGSKLRTS